MREEIDYRKKEKMIGRQKRVAYERGNEGHRHKSEKRRPRV